MRQQHTYPIEAIILKRTDIGEADRILTLFTPNKGKFAAVAKGIRRPISKKAGHLELLSHSQLHMALGRNLDIVTQAEGRDSFLNLRTDLWYMTCGCYLAELVDRFIEDTTIHAEVYNFLLELLRSLDAEAVAHAQRTMRDDSEGKGAGARDALTSLHAAPPDQEHGYTQLLLRYFEIHLLGCIGYEPAFRKCAHCASELQPVENGFAPSAGGVLCPQCSRLSTRALSVNSLKVLRLLQRSAWRDVPRLRLTAALYAELEAVMHSLLRYHLERDLKSWSFLDMLSIRK